MGKIIGNTIATPMTIPDWNQTDETKADYIKNKPNIGDLASLTEIGKENLTLDVQESLDKADNSIQSLDGYATETYVGEQIAAMVDSAPETLDTLKELAEALGDDPNFATTMATEIGKKVDKVDGKNLSTNDFTDTLKSKLEGLADVATSGSFNDLVDTPTVDTEFEWGSSSKNAISHEAVASEMALLNSDIGMEIETVRGDISMLQNLLDEVSVEIEDLGDVEEAEVFITNNTIKAYGLVSTSLVCYLEGIPSIGFTSCCSHLAYICIHHISIKIKYDCVSHICCRNKCTIFCAITLKIYVVRESSIILRYSIRGCEI